MMSPNRIIQSNPFRPRESPQNYALRMLKVALEAWTAGVFDNAIQIVDEERQRHEDRPTDGHDKRCEERGAINALGNVEIELHEMKLLQLELIRQ